MKHKKSMFRFLLLNLMMVVFLSGCLKTRASLKSEKNEDDQTEAQASSTPVPAPQPIQPHGGYVIDEIKLEITRLTGRIEQLEQNQKSQESQESKVTPQMLEDLNRRIDGLEKAINEKFNELTKEPSKETNKEPLTDEPSNSFQKGKKEFEAKQYEDAIDSFGLYLKNPKAKHAEEATFLRGEAYYELKQYKKTILELSKFTDKYTKSKRAPAALYKIGQSFDALGMKDDAKGFYQELTEKFPKSSEAKKAKQKLK